jgi:hypothetical protein
VFASRRRKLAWSFGDKTIENRRFAIAQVDPSPGPVVKAGKACPSR